MAQRKSDTSLYKRIDRKLLGEYIKKPSLPIWEYRPNTCVDSEKCIANINKIHFFHLFFKRLIYVNRYFAFSHYICQKINKIIGKQMILIENNSIF